MIGWGGSPRVQARDPAYTRRGSAISVPVMVAIRLSAPSACANAQAAHTAACGAARLKNVGQLYRATGLPPEAADAQAFLFYCFIFGQSLLFLERGPRKRAQLIAQSAAKLLDDQS